MKNLSILIPAHNYVCVGMVSTLQQQAATAGISYEILVADDGSTDQSAVSANRPINDLPHCRFIERPRNVGRAAIRNFLALQAQYDYLLFLDCDMEVANPQFILRYATATGNEVVDGGISIGGNAAELRHNIRYLYEHQAAPRHTAGERQKNPYRSFRTTNFMIARQLMLFIPFDERFLHYGYEDVLFGKQLQRHGVTISHIDNPTVLTDFESNEVFVSKTEEAMRTLHLFSDELRGYSSLLDLTDRLPRLPFRLLYRLIGTVCRNRLIRRPSVPLFSLYRLTYFMSLS